RRRLWRRQRSVLQVRANAWCSSTRHPRPAFRRSWAWRDSSASLFFAAFLPQVSAARGRLVNAESIRYAPSMTVTVRFAPSPTGKIHIGNARAALFNWLFALKHRGRFIQRFDDTDVLRSRQEYADAILYDLHWLGIFQDADRKSVV